jgi:hypothetical protein
VTPRTKKRELVWTTVHALVGRHELLCKNGLCVGYIDTHHSGDMLTDSQLLLAARAACRALNAAERKKR